jgi:hypothetical protein
VPAAQTPFRPSYGLTTEHLAAHGITRHITDTKPGFPARIGRAA